MAMQGDEQEPEEETTMKIKTRIKACPGGGGCQGGCI